MRLCSSIIALIVRVPFRWRQEFLTNNRQRFIGNSPGRMLRILILRRLSMLLAKNNIVLLLAWRCFAPTTCVVLMSYVISPPLLRWKAFDLRRFVRDKAKIAHRIEWIFKDPLLGLFFSGVGKDPYPENSLLKRWRRHRKFDLLSFSCVEIFK